MNSLQSVYRGDLKPSIELRNELKDVAKRLINESMQRIQQKFDQLLRTSMKNDIQVNIATTTETIPTTSPANPFTVNDTLPKPTMIESFVYGNKEFSSSSSDVEFLTSEDYDLVKSISDPTYSEICIPSAMPNSTDNSTSPVPPSPSFNDLVSVSYNLLAITQIKFDSNKQFSNLICCTLFNENNVYNRFTAFIINCHRIFFWDPGIY